MKIPEDNPSPETSEDDSDVEDTSDETENDSNEESDSDENVGVTGETEPMSNEEDCSDDDAEPEDFSSDILFPKTYQIKHEEALSLQKVYVLFLSACFENNEIKLAAGLSDFQVAIYDVENGFRKTMMQRVHDDVITGVEFVNKNSNLLHTSSLDGTIKLWDLRVMEKPASIFKDDTDGENQLKPINCFGLSSDGKFVCGGSTVVDADAFVLFWDTRNPKVLGGYWETHTDDVTSIAFHPVKSNTMVSGSTDGLINLFDISASSEDDALQNSYNVDTCIRKLKWINMKNEDRIACITDMETLQFWKTEDSGPFLDFSRKLLGSAMHIRSSDNAYVSDIHQSTYDQSSEIVVLGGSNVRKGEYLKSLVFDDNKLQPFATFADNKQIVRCSCYKDGTFITAGESGIVSVWEITDQYTNKMQLKERTKKFKHNA